MGTPLEGLTTMPVLANAGAPSNGTSEVQTITISAFAACTLAMTYEGATASVTFTGSEDNTAIDTAVTTALEGLRTIGTGGVTVSVSGTTNRAIAVTFAGNLGKLAVNLITAAVTGGSAVAATLSTNLTGTNNDLTFTAVTAGTGGNSVTVTYVDPSGNNQALAISVLGSAITASLATGGGGAITSTAAQIKTAIEASAAASALVTVANKSGNDGTGVVTAMAATALSGGTAAPSVAVVETTPGVTATGRGAGPGRLLSDTTNAKLYINTGTALAPTWTVVGSQS